MILKKLKTITILGALVILTPFLGIPRSWKSIVLVVLGAGIVVLASMLRRTLQKSTEKEIEHTQPPASSAATLDGTIPPNQHST